MKCHKILHVARSNIVVQTMKGLKLYYYLFFEVLVPFYSKVLDKIPKL